MKQPSPEAAVKRDPKLSDLSAPRQVLVRLFQAVDYGMILDLHVQDGQPIFHPLPTVVRDIRLNATCDRRLECELDDFALRGEVCRLLEQLDQTGTGRVQQIEVRAGIPRRVLIEAKIAEPGR